MRQLPTPPAAPPPPAPGVTITLPAGQGGAAPQVATPLTRAQVRDLRERRSELSNQLNSAADRRAELAQQLVGKQGADRSGVEQRITLLDERILQLESDIAETGRQLTSVPRELGTSTEEPTMFGGLEPGQVTGISIVFTIFVLFPLAIAAARLMWKRAVAPRPSPALMEGAQRLERVEQAVDTIAIEIERISEGQRFVTRLLTETRGAEAVGAGERQAERIGVMNAGAARGPHSGA